jgi:orotidine 5'-phosphate decarboxylase subfamily 1
LCYSADDLYGKNIDKAMKKIDLLGPYICMLKLHPDICSNFTMEMIKEIKRMSKKYSFLILIDRKLADIGKIVKLQIENKYWFADVLTVHLISGPGIIEVINQIEKEWRRDIGILLIAEMSSIDNLIDESYTNKVVEFAKYYDVMGFICQHKLDEELLCCMPGVSVKARDVEDQGYTSVKSFMERRMDVMIVGSSIYNSSDPVAEAKKYSGFI